jgi:cytidylate kinase
MTKPSTIAIDGPSASGKSTVGELLSRQLGYLYFDTGVMYRAVTCLALQRELDVNDEAQISALAEQIKIDVLPPTVSDGRQNTILVNGNDLTNDLRHPLIDANVSVVSAYPRVRAAMVSQQRLIGARGNVVMIGRDIATVVLPHAELKIYLTASIECRAMRRYRENVARGDPTSFAEVLRLLQRRDQIDSERKTSPLRAAADAHVINTETLTIAQVVAAIAQLWQ